MAHTYSKNFNFFNSDLLIRFYFNCDAFPMVVLLLIYKPIVI